MSIKSPNINRNLAEKDIAQSLKILFIRSINCRFKPQCCLDGAVDDAEKLAMFYVAQLILFLRLLSTSDPSLPFEHDV